MRARTGGGWDVRYFREVYRFLLDWDVLPEQRKQLLNRREAERVLIHAASDSHWNGDSIDSMRSELSYGENSWLRRSELESPLDELLEAVRSARLVALKSEVSKPTQVYRPAVEEPWEKPPPEPVKVTATMELKFVYDQADKGVGALEFKVRTADGKEQAVKTDGQGALRLRNIEPGYVEVWTEFENARLETTVTMRAQGEVPTLDFTDDFETEKPAKHLLRVDALRVHAGETFLTIAEDCEIPWKTLALFNFGTDDEKELTKHLSKEVGARGAKALDKLKFDETDRPGVLFLPRRWRASFHSSESPIIRVAGIDAPSPPFNFSN